MDDEADGSRSRAMKVEGSLLAIGGELDGRFAPVGSEGYETWSVSAIHVSTPQSPRYVLIPKGATDEQALRAASDRLFGGAECTITRAP